MYSIIQGSIEVLVRGAPPWVPERIPFESEEQVKDYMAEDDAIRMKYEATDQVIPGYTNEETQEVVVSKVIYEIYSLKSVFKASDGFTFGVDALLTGNPRYIYNIYIYIYIILEMQQSEQQKIAIWLHSPKINMIYY